MLTKQSYIGRMKALLRHGTGGQIMNKTSIWTAIAMFIVCAASIGYAAVTHAVPEQPKEVKIIHTYDDGYADGYRNGKEQALEDIASFYG